MLNLFSDKPLNSKRQIELDVAKALAIIFMVLVHVNEVYQSPSYEGGLYSQLVEFLGSPPAAPVFMFLLGVGIIYSKRNEGQYLFKRGIFLLVLGYGLNFFRDYIPYSILAIRDSDPSSKVEAINCFFGIDILQFAGLTFLFFAFIKKFKIRVKYLPLFWLTFATVNLFVRGKSTGIYLTNALFGLIFGTSDYSWFPFLSWIFYPILGYIFGYFLIRCKNKKLLYKNCLLFSFIALIPLYFYAYINKVHFGAFGELYQTTYYHHDIMGNVILGTFTIFWISLVFFITPYISSKILVHFSRWSKNLNLIYCVHWLLLGYTMLFLEQEAYTPVIICIIALIIFIISDFISQWIYAFKKQRSSSNNSLAA